MTSRARQSAIANVAAATAAAAGQRDSDRIASTSIPRGTTPNAEPARATRGGRNAGAQNYSAETINKLLDIVHEIKPHGTQKWERVLLELQS